MVTAPEELGGDAEALDVLEGEGPPDDTVPHMEQAAVAQGEGVPRPIGPTVTGHGGSNLRPQQGRERTLLQAGLLVPGDGSATGVALRPVPLEVRLSARRGPLHEVDDERVHVVPPVTAEGHRLDNVRDEAFRPGARE